MILYPFIGQLTEHRIACAHFQQDSVTAHTAHVSVVLLHECLVTNFKGHLATEIT